MNALTFPSIQCSHRIILHNNKHKDSISSHSPQQTNIPIVSIPPSKTWRIKSKALLSTMIQEMAVEDSQIGHPIYNPHLLSGLVWECSLHIIPIPIHSASIQVNNSLAPAASSKLEHTFFAIHKASALFTATTPLGPFTQPRSRPQSPKDFGSSDASSRGTPQQPLNSFNASTNPERAQARASACCRRGIACYRQLRPRVETLKE